MAGRFCNGDRFTGDGATYYRCAKDFKVVDIASHFYFTDGDECPNCGREVDADDNGDVETETTITKTASLISGESVIYSQHSKKQDAK